MCKIRFEGYTDLFLSVFNDCISSLQGVQLQILELFKVLSQIISVAGTGWTQNTNNQRALGTLTWYIVA
jgi:hypothetical protein